tara:strand:+ start:338 stop:901 length:564 start_codon:yes stop_codon:yes gene_type:complete
MLTSYTSKPENFKYLDQYKSILNNIVDKKTDYLWKNYVDFKFEEQTALTVGLEDDKVKVISSIINKDIWPKGVYRLMNRYYVEEDYRDKGGTKSHRGEGYQIAHILLNDQIKYLKDNIDYSFYFLSRQKNKKFLSYWTDKFNREYNQSLKVSDKRYWICNSTEFNCHQVLVYDEQYKIPFISEKKDK